MLSASFAASISGESALPDEVASQVSQRLPLPPIIKTPTQSINEPVSYEKVSYIYYYDA